MSWMTDVLHALKKIILIEEESVMTEDIVKLTDKMVDIDRRLLKLETKLEVLRAWQRREIS